MQKWEDAEQALARSVKWAKIWSTALLVLTLVLAIAAVFLVRDWIRCSTFSPEHWQEAPQERNAMLHDLLREHNLYACSKGQVLELLGPPELSVGGGVGYRIREGRYLWFQFDGDNVRKVHMKTASDL